LTTLLDNDRVYYESITISTLEIAIYIFAGLQVIIIAFALWLIYSLNEKIMIMSKSTDVYDYVEGQKTTIKDELDDPEEIDITQLDDDSFRKALTNTK